MVLKTPADSVTALCVIQHGPAGYQHSQCPCHSAGYQHSQCQCHSVDINTPTVNVTASLLSIFPMSVSPPACYQHSQCQCQHQPAISTPNVSVTTSLLSTLPMSVSFSIVQLSTLPMSVSPPACYQHSQCQCHPQPAINTPNVSVIQHGPVINIPNVSVTASLLSTLPMSVSPLGCYQHSQCQCHHQPAINTPSVPVYCEARSSWSARLPLFVLLTVPWSHDPLAIKAPIVSMTASPQ